MLSGNNGNLHRNLLALLIAGVGIAATGGIVTLSVMDKEYPPILAGIVGTALGSLATALTRFPPPTPEELTKHAPPVVPPPEPPQSPRRRKP